MDVKKVVLVGIICALVLAGCAQNQEDQGQSMTEPFIGGSVGLNTYLLEGLPPKVIQDNNQSPFSVAVALENQGESDVGPQTQNPFMRVKLEGINPEQWGLNPNETVKTLSQTLRGARKNFDGTILPGEITQVTFENLNYEKNIRGNTPFTMRADVCYDYSTTSTTQICIKDDVLEHIQDTTICMLSGEKNPRNSGAPVHITSLKQNPMGANKIQLAFTIEHVGTGQFYWRNRTDGSQELCNPSAGNTNKNRLKVIVKPIDDSGYTLNCPRLSNGNSGVVRLSQGAPQRVTCTLERTRPSQGRIFQSVLEIELQYRYGQFIEQPIIVQDVSNDPGETVGNSSS